MPSVLLVNNRENQNTEGSAVRRRLVARSMNSSRASAPYSGGSAAAHLQRIRERPRLVAVIRVPALNTEQIMRLLLAHFQQNEHNIMFPDQDYLRERIQTALLRGHR